MTWGPITRLFAARPAVAAAALAAMLALLALPALNLSLRPGSPLHVPDLIVTVVGKWMCFAILALSIDLI